MVFQRRDKKTFWQNAYPSSGWKRALGYIWLRLKRRPGSPDYIAKGFAIGILISFTPFIGIHFVGAIVLAWLFRADIIASVLASMLINAPITFGVIFPLTYRVGKAILNLRPRLADVQIDSYNELMNQIWPITSMKHFIHVFSELFIPMTVGGLVTGFPVAMASYYLVRKAVMIFKEQRSALLHKRTKHQFDSVEAEIERDNPHIK